MGAGASLALARVLPAAADPISDADLAWARLSVAWELLLREFYGRALAFRGERALERAHFNTTGRWPRS